MKLDADKLNTLEAAAIAAGRGDAWGAYHEARRRKPLVPYDPSEKRAANVVAALIELQFEDWSELRRLADAMNSGGDQ